MGYACCEFCFGGTAGVRNHSLTTAVALLWRQIVSSMRLTDEVRAAVGNIVSATRAVLGILHQLLNHGRVRRRLRVCLRAPCKEGGIVCVVGPVLLAIAFVMFR